jgi:hypothetical protein
VPGNVISNSPGTRPPFIAYAIWATHHFFSLRIGCQVLQSVYGTDLGALCIRKKK